MFNIATSSQHYSERVLLYKLVFRGRVSFLLLIFLFSSFLLQPFYRALASTDEGALSTTELLPESESLDSAPLPSDISPADVIPLPVIDGTEEQSSSTELQPAVDTTGVDVPVEIVESDTGNGSLDVSDEAVSTSTLSDDITAVVSTTSEPESAPLVHESFSDDEVRFAKDKCVQVEGGAYYCQANQVSGINADRVIAEPDSGGDLEIFVVKNGEYFQLTHNFIDDASPQYDARSETMVWHRQLSERYSIVSYDVVSATESYLTDGTYNDMEPRRFGTFTVWQRWIDGYWQIMLHDGTQERQITQTQNHHMAPSIRGEVIMWHSSSQNGEQVLETYDLVTGQTYTINDSDNAAMSNPRMMMVYEAMYDNGDRVMRGVDLETGAIVALGLIPTSLPEELPTSESTGETRALIQNKSEEHDEELGQGGPKPEPVGPPAASSSDSLTINLRTELPTTTVSASVPTSTPFDLYIGPASSTQNLLEP